MYLYIYISATVISGPDDVTICEGGSTTFTCVLEDSRISSDNVHWYRVLMGTSTTVVRVNQSSNIHFTTSTINNTLNSSVTITNAMKSYAGDYLVGTPYYSVCRASLTVAESKYVHNTLAS